LFNGAEGLLMTGFSASWLALREGADHRSRNPDLVRRLAGRFIDTPDIHIVDLGSGTGSNLRATAPLLGARQAWTLVDYDAALLKEAARALTHWADEARPMGDSLRLVKGGKHIDVAFRIADLNQDLESVLGSRPDLVTASALFDLISVGWMEWFAAALVASGASFYTVLTYDGRDDFSPAHAHDRAVIAAFASHQTRDKGFGPAAGPQAAKVLIEAFIAVGYAVETGDSPWVLGPADALLVEALLGGLAGAVAETGRVPAEALGDWLAFRKAEAVKAGSWLMTGHTDIIAHPR
jgi:SAM-dependent methyltransferase